MQVCKARIIITNPVRLFLPRFSEAGRFEVNSLKHFAEAFYDGFEERDDGGYVLDGGEGVERADWAVDQRGDGGHGFAEGDDDLWEGEVWDCLEVG